MRIGGRGATYQDILDINITGLSLDISSIFPKSHGMGNQCRMVAWATKFKTSFNEPGSWKHQVHFSEFMFHDFFEKHKNMMSDHVHDLFQEAPTKCEAEHQNNKGSKIEILSQKYKQRRGDQVRDLSHLAKNNRRPSSKSSSRRANKQW